MIGGLTAGAVVVPQAIAYASIADLPADVGLATCMVPLVVYAALGGSRTLSMTTTSTVAVLSGTTLVGAAVAAAAEDPATDLATLTMLVGVILLVARILRLGSLVDNISEATLTGIKIGVGLTVAASQLPALVGLPGDPSVDAFFGEVRSVLDRAADINGPTVVLSVGTIVLLGALALVAPRVPGPLVAVVTGILLVRTGSIDTDGVALIPPVPAGLPRPVTPDLTRVAPLLAGALAVSFMCFMETASVANAVRRRVEPPIDDDQELVANGWACALGGIFQSMPAAGGFSQTAVNVRAGSRSQLSGLVVAGLAVACALFLGGLLSDLPEATLAAMVFVAVVSLVDPRPLARFWRLDRLSFWVAVVTAIAGLVLGLLAAVLVGVLATLFLVLRELSAIGVTELQLTAADDLEPAGSTTDRIPGLLVLRLDGALYAANVRRVGRAIVDAVDEAHASTVVLEASALVTTTVTVIDELDELEQRLADRGVELWIAALPARAAEVAARTAGFRRLREQGRIHRTGRAAVRSYLGEVVE